LIVIVKNYLLNLKRITVKKNRTTIIF